MPSISTLSILESASCCPMNDPEHHDQQSNGGTRRVSYHHAFHPCSSRTRTSSEDFTMMNPPEANDRRHDHSSSLFQQQSLASALPFDDEDEEELRLVVQPVTDDHFDVSFRSLFETTHESLGCPEEDQEEPLLSRKSHQVFSGRIMMTSNNTNHESMAASSSTTAGLKRTAHGSDDDCSFSSKDESEARQKRPRRTTAPSPSPSSVVSSVLVVSSCCADSSVSSRSAVSHHDGWSAKVQELQEFKLKHGHSSVPCSTSSNDEEGTASLARWVKRQRHQYKRKRNGQTSTMTDERMAQLENECDFLCGIPIRTPFNVDGTNWPNSRQRTVTRRRRS